MSDFRLKVFVSVARHLNFTKAAQELYISQPAITKHIQELESTYKVRLFDRQGGKITLTHAGEIMLHSAESIIESYNRLQIEMNLLSNNLSGELRIGASTTIAQYLLPRIVAQFVTRFPDVRISLISDNSTQIEEALFQHRIDLGLMEGNSRRQGLRYRHFADDKLVLTTAATNRSAPDTITISELTTLPMVLRESGSGTLEVIEQALASQKIRISSLNTVIQLGSTESIKLFLANSSAFAILSIISVADELTSGTLRVVDIDNLPMRREFVFAQSLGDSNPLSEQFMRFAEHSRNL